MKNFMDKDFLLSNDTAKKLYHDFASKKPILDYHCHINPKEIYENRLHSKGVLGRIIVDQSPDLTDPLFNALVKFDHEI